MLQVSDPDAIVKSLPAVTAPPDTVPEYRNVPADDAVHRLKCVYVSVFDTVVHAAAEFDALSPDAAAAIVIDLRVEFPAIAVVPAAPGAAVCS